MLPTDNFFPMYNMLCLFTVHVTMGHCQLKVGGSVGVQILFVGNFSILPLGQLFRYGLALVDFS